MPFGRFLGDVKAHQYLAGDGWFVGHFGLVAVVKSNDVRGAFVL